MRSWSTPAIPRITGTTVPLQLYDTSRQAILPVSPGDTATLYVCGITPYDSTHLGHAATYLTFDLIYRLLLDNGHDVHYVQNVTDVDDPLFERAHRDNVDWQDLGNAQTDLFRSDMEALRIIPPTNYVGATESIDEVIELVERLLQVGAAYQIDAADDPKYQDIYYSVHATSQFGYESGYDVDTMTAFFAERGGDPQRLGKRHPLDALLWRQQRPGEPSWESPWGRGRPGWHIECGAIALNRLGAPFDIQGGGSDLIFPHHEFSAAHVEAATGCSRMARFYVHTGMIGLAGTKMSKSLGNLVFVSQLLADGIRPGAIRLGLYSGHYSSDRQWTPTVLEQANSRLAKWMTAVQQKKTISASHPIAEVRAALADNLDTPRALRIIDVWADHSLRGLGESSHAGQDMAECIDALLGIKLI